MFEETKLGPKVGDGIGQWTKIRLVYFSAKSYKDS